MTQPGAGQQEGRRLAGRRPGRDLRHRYRRRQPRGADAEAIVREYPTLVLADVYGALAYYLRHREESEREGKKA
jgi:hypothetical protein